MRVCGCEIDLVPARVCVSVCVRVSVPLSLYVSVCQPVSVCVSLCESGSVCRRDSVCERFRVGLYTVHSELIFVYGSVNSHNSMARLDYRLYIKLETNFQDVLRKFSPKKNIKQTGIRKFNK